MDAQERDPASLLGWFQRVLLAMRECPEFSLGTCRYVDTGERSVLALIHDAPSGTMLAVVNLAPAGRTIVLGPQPETEGAPMEVFADRTYPAVDASLEDVTIAGYGYRWIRLRRTLGARAGSTH